MFSDFLLFILDLLGYSEDIIENTLKKYVLFFIIEIILAGIISVFFMYVIGWTFKGLKIFINKLYQFTRPIILPLLWFILFLWIMYYGVINTTDYYVNITIYKIFISNNSDYQWTLQNNIENTISGWLLLLTQKTMEVIENRALSILLKTNSSF